MLGLPLDLTAILPLVHGLQAFVALAGTLGTVGLLLAVIQPDEEAAGSSHAIRRAA